MNSDVDSGTSGSSVGDRLKAAREERGLSLDDIATKTRIPIRHLAAIENGDWDSLPAVTYSVGFVRNYANIVGLSGKELGQEVREQLGGAQTYATGAPYEPADPARVPPRSLALAAGLLALLLVVAYVIWRSSSAAEPDMLEQATAEEPAVVATATPVAGAPATVQRPPAPPPAATGPVLLTATNDVWVRIYDGGPSGSTLLQRQMQAGETFEIPATAQQPMIRTARAEALRVRVGSTDLPQLGPPGAATNISLLPQDLLRSGAPAAAAPAQQPAAPVTR